VGGAWPDGCGAPRSWRGWQRDTGSSWDDADRMTSADRMTTASSAARRTGYSRIGDRMTAVSDGGDMGPSLMPMGSMPRDDVGDDWEEQQRRWAGGRAPVATGPRSVEDFSDIEEAAAGVQGDRYSCAQTHRHSACVYGGTQL
jgi:hypothetical protein